MRKKVLAALMAAAIAGGYVGIAEADPGPHHGNNDHGLCTAYFNGQKNGHGSGEDQPPPFASLEETAEAASDAEGFEAIYDWCTAMSTIGGNPDHGRFTCVDNPDVGNADETNCTENTDGPGGSENSNARGRR